tara:strand:- start:12 stop:929 length:918 start_codon:yes stop_codon:yes gene_type:complete
MITQFKITWVENLYDNLPKELELTRYGLFSFLEPKEVNSKKDVCLFSPCWYNVPIRQKKWVKQVTMIVFDIDSGIEYPDMDKINPEFLDVFWMVYPTFSYTPEHPKYRVIIPLAKPVPGYVWGKIWEDQIKPIFGKFMNDDSLSIHPDKACKDAGRVYYLPSKKKGKEYPDPILYNGKKYFDLKWTKPVEVPAKKPQYGYKGLKHATHDSIDRMTRYRLNHTEDGRIALAQRQNLKIYNDRVEGFPCPSCGRNHTFYYTKVSKTEYCKRTNKKLRDYFSSAQCKHVGNCGWSDTLYNYASLMGWA